MWMVVEVVARAGDATAVAVLEVVVQDERADDEVPADVKAEVALVEDGAKDAENHKREMKLLPFHQLTLPQMLKRMSRFLLVSRRLRNLPLFTAHGGILFQLLLRHPSQFFQLLSRLLKCKRSRLRLALLLRLRLAHKLLRLSDPQVMSGPPRDRPT